MSDQHAVMLFQGSPTRLLGRLAALAATEWKIRAIAWAAHGSRPFRRHAIPSLDLASMPLTPESPAAHGEATEVVLKAIRRSLMCHFIGLEGEIHDLDQLGWGGARPDGTET
jgi:hypothetical protein